ncbi:hypothetical protein YK56LOC_16770 [Caballeronia sp. HLA56]
MTDRPIHAADQDFGHCIGGLSGGGKNGGLAGAKRQVQTHGVSLQGSKWSKENSQCKDDARTDPEPEALYRSTITRWLYQNSNRSA